MKPVLSLVRLDPVHPGVDTAQSDQFFMGTDTGYFTLIQDNDLVRVHDRTDAGKLWGPQTMSSGA